MTQKHNLQLAKKGFKMQNNELTTKEKWQSQIYITTVKDRGFLDYNKSISILRAC